SSTASASPPELRHWRRGARRSNRSADGTGTSREHVMRIAFIGLGNMGGGMAANQAKAGREVLAFDLSAEAMRRAAEAGCTPQDSAAEAVKTADVVITMLPAGQHVRKVYAEQVLPNAPQSALLIDCSTIDVDS